eukprot:GHVR01185570.1.p1 GENE.GHVR01185570.1~~GHVR01185570.1.p1  ORF type:complete len:200 (-),score=18.51 GHVR01185570.1:316-915(-)
MIFDNIFIQILTSLAYLHDPLTRIHQGKSVMHENVIPKNIYLTNNLNTNQLQCKLGNFMDSDFGTTSKVALHTLDYKRILGIIMFKFCYLIEPWFNDKNIIGKSSYKVIDKSNYLYSLVMIKGCFDNGLINIEKTTSPSCLEFVQYLKERTKTTDRYRTPQQYLNIVYAEVITYLMQIIYYMMVSQTRLLETVVKIGLN